MQCPCADSVSLRATPTRSAASQDGERSGASVRASCAVLSTWQASESPGQFLGMELLANQRRILSSRDTLVQVFKLWLAAFEDEYYVSGNWFTISPTRRVVNYTD
jgi:hypothetical protein